MSETRKTFRIFRTEVQSRLSPEDMEDAEEIKKAVEKISNNEGVCISKLAELAKMEVEDRADWLVILGIILTVITTIIMLITAFFTYIYPLSPSVSNSDRWSNWRVIFVSVLLFGGFLLLVGFTFWYFFSFRKNYRFDRLFASVLKEKQLDEERE